MNDTLTELYCLVDDFCKEFIPFWSKQQVTNGLRQRRRESRLSIAEIMTIVIHFHQSGYRTFKHYYLNYICTYLRPVFPDLVSYPRFVALMKTTIVPLCFFLQTLKGEQTGIYFVDSTLIKVCHIKREKQHKVFAGLAEKGKSTMGWFYGFKLHLVINDKGELIAFKVTAGNVDDRKPVSQMVSHLAGKLIGDKGYISQKLTDELLGKGLQLITGIKKNMKNKLLPMMDKLLLRKRGLIETVNDQLKNLCQLEHTRHRSVWNFFVNVLGALTAYALQPKKPSIRRNTQVLTAQT